MIQCSNKLYCAVSTVIVIASKHSTSVCSWAQDERIRFWGQKVKGQRSKM